MPCRCPLRYAAARLHGFKEGGFGSPAQFAQIAHEARFDSTRSGEVALGKADP